MKPHIKPLNKAIKDITKAPRGLNKKIWENENKIKPSVKEKLLVIAEELWDDLEHGDAELQDIVFTGSMTGERWSDDSDIDLHLIVQFSDVNPDEDFVNSYYRARTRLWNTQHDISIDDHPIEVYVQDSKQEHYSIGIYSLIEDKWILKREPGKFATYNEVAKKAKVLARDIKELIKYLNSNPGLQKIESASSFMEKLQKMRKVGLESQGEGSVENLAYKALRRAGLFDKLNDSLNKSFDKLFTT